MKGLTSHVLDTLVGKPAIGVKVQLWSCQGLERDVLLAEAVTNNEGRCVLAEELAVARYEILFFTDEYFAEQKYQLAQPPFLDVVSVRFAVADSLQHYHIPLVASPWSYCTYKGGAPKSH